MQKFTDPQLKPALSEIAGNKELPKNVRKQAIDAIGEYDDRKITALVCDMNQPLGRAVGNALEIREAIDVLHDCGADDIR